MSTDIDGNNYCRILKILGMEEEGDPVAWVAASAAREVALAERVAELGRAEGQRQDWPGSRVDVRVGDVWHIKRRGAWACDTKTIAEVTPATVKFTPPAYAVEGERLMRCDVQFVERVSTANPPTQQEPAPQAADAGVTEPRWRALADEMPEPECFVLTWDGKKVRIDWWGSLRYRRGDNTTHWCPFPAPPGQDVGRSMYGMHSIRRTASSADGAGEPAGREGDAA